MIIAVGSANTIKVQAVDEALQHYPHLSSAEIVSIDVPSEVSTQPLSLEEIIKGAKNRAKNAFNQLTSCKYSFGIESGLSAAPGTNTGFLESCICCIYDGKDYYMGISCGFEIPPPILKYVLNQNMDLSDACFHSKVTSNPKLGSSEGLIGILTKGKVNRKEYTKQSITMALIQIENNSLYISDSPN